MTASTCSTKTTNNYKPSFLESKFSFLKNIITMNFTTMAASTSSSKTTNNCQPKMEILLCSENKKHIDEVSRAKKYLSSLNYC